MANHLASNQSKRVQKIIVGICSCTIGLIVLGLILLTLSQAFQGIVLNSLTKMESEFVSQTDALSNIMDTMVRNYGLQIFSTPAAILLREGEGISDQVKRSCLLELNSYVNSSDFLYSINIYNPSSGYIYSTDTDLATRSIEDFEDQSAASLFLNLNPQMQMKPIRRTAFPLVPWREKEYYSFLFSESRNDHSSLKKGAVMLNIPYEWYIGQLMSFDDKESSVILNETGGLIAASNDQVGRWAMHFRQKIVSMDLEEYESNYLITTIKKRPVVCYFSRMKSNGWYYLHVETLDECIPGLLRLRNTLEAWIALGVIILTIIAIVVTLNILFPFRRIRQVLNQKGDFFSPTETQVTELVESYQAFHQASILQDLLEGRCDSYQEILPPPFVLIMVETDDSTKIREILQKVCPKSLIHRQSGYEIILLPKARLHDSKALCEILIDKVNGRILYSMPRFKLSDIPNSYEKLKEMRLQCYWSPEQKLWSEKNFKPRNTNSGFSEKSVTGLISTLRTGDLEEGKKQWSRILSSIKNDNYLDQMFSFSRVSQLLAKVVEELDGPQEILVTDEYLEELKDVKKLSEKLYPIFQYIAETSESRRNQRLEDLANRVTKIIDANYTNPSLSLAGIADDIGMSGAYLGRVFRRSLGISVSDYLNNVRVQRASEMLTNTSLPVKTIALKVGFSNSKYFFVVFKKIVGLTPLQYRERNAPVLNSNLNIPKPEPET